MSDQYIQFEPSDFGNGFKATIRPDLGTDLIGWARWYGHLRGVAEYPPEWFTLIPWAVTVVNRLRDQGVEFV